ncbi:MAG: hypothetical protein OSB03_14960 [Vicinamibacterales bacterium]|jgi:hypothetical protein|nr:hypothetical protein [Vicinamibacterales bacterium]
MVTSKQCTATSKQAKRRCRQPAIRGGTVCRFHGGAAPQVKLAAKDRIAGLVDPALDALQRALEPSTKGAALQKLAKLLLHEAGEALPVAEVDRLGPKCLEVITHDLVKDAGGRLPRFVGRRWGGHAPPSAQPVPRSVPLEKVDFSDD